MRSAATHILSKLFDSRIVYCKDKSALERLDEIRRKAAELPASDRRYEKADKVYSDAKKMLAEVCLAQSLSKARSCAGAAIEFIENAVMLYNGQYFRKGTKRTRILTGKTKWPRHFESMTEFVEDYEKRYFKKDKND